MSRQKKKRIRAMRRKIARRHRYTFSPAPFLAPVPGEPGAVTFRFVYSGTCIEGKITLP